MTLLREQYLIGEVDDNNSSATPLAGGVAFEGVATEILNCGVVFVNVYTSHASATDGLSIQQSSDGTNWDHSDEYTVEAGASKNYSINPHSKYFRVVYTNGGTLQTAFRLQSVCKTQNAKPSSHRAKDDISGEDDCELVKSALAGENGNGLWHNVKVNAAGVMLSSNFLIEVAKGNVEGHSIINKFGHNPLVPVTGADVWAGGGTYGFYPTTAQSMEVISTSTNDDGAPTGTGAWNVQVWGLDTNWVVQTETVTLNGTTAVSLASTYLRVYRARVLQAGSSETNEGAIVVRIAGGGTTAAYIGVDDGQTQQCVFTIPAATTGFFLKGYVGLTHSDKNGQDGTFQWLGRPNTMADGAWAVQGQMSLVNIGSSHWQYEYGAPAGPLPEKTDVRIRMTVASAIMDTVGGFDILLVEDGF